MTKNHVFLSYCHDDMFAVSKIRDSLISAGEVVWWDQDILGGQDWQWAIRTAMSESYAVVLCLSQHLEQRLQSGVYPELLDAIKSYRRQAPGSIFLIPVKLSPCKTPDVEIDDARTLDRLQAIDLFPDSQWRDGLTQLLASLRAISNHP